METLKPKQEKKHKGRRRILWLIAGILVIWALLTLWVEAQGPVKMVQVGTNDASQRALVVYDPDPIYNLDEQVCQAYATGLSMAGWQVTVATVRAAKGLEERFDHYAFCANTYNWGPDRAVSRFIRSNADLGQKPVAAITVGSGSTARAERLLQQKIIDQKAKLVGSVNYWLMRPNDESRMDESNVAVAQDLAEKFGQEMALALSAHQGK